MALSPFLDESSFAGPRAFARHMLATGFPMAPFIGGLHTAPEGHPGGRAMEGILFRNGPWQIELVIMPPHCQVQLHRHVGFESVELALGGTGTAFIDGRTVISPEVRPEQRGRAISNLVRVGHGAWHEGFAGPNGAVFLSFQQWVGQPGFIADDWEAPNV